MKIIDLLNKIANGEEVPKKIKIFGHIFFYTGDKRPQRFYRMDTQDNYLLRDFVYTLDSEVEIIEEDKKIEKIKNLNSDDENDISTLGVALDFNTIKNKINEIIDILSNL